MWYGFMSTDDIFDLGKYEAPTVKVTKLELLKNGKKDILQKAAGE